MTSRYRLRSYLAGATAARTADEMSAPALLLLGLAVTGSARSAALLYAGLTISAAAGGLVLGALLDRSDRPGRLLGWALTGYAAGLAVGYWRNREDLVSNWAVNKRWNPQMPENRRAALFGRWQKAVGRSLDWTE